MTGERRWSPRPRSTARSTRSAMEGIRHAAPVESVGAHAWTILAGEQVSTPAAWRCTAQARAHTTTHGRFEGDLDRGRRDLPSAGLIHQRLQHGRRTAGEDLEAPSLTLPHGGTEIWIREQTNDGAVMAGTPVVGGHANFSRGESLGREQLCFGPGAEQHRDGPAAVNERPDHAGKDRNPESARDTDRWSMPRQVEASAKRAEEIQLVTGMSSGEPGAPGADDIEDESDATARRIRPGGAVGPAQQSVGRANADLKEL